MERREYVAAVFCTICGVNAGCLADDEPKPEPVIDSLELENHRREEDHEFTVQIEDEEEIIFEETHRLDSADSGNGATVIENPVEPGAYTIRVTVDEYSATADTQNLVESEKPCLRLKFFLGSETLHMEPQSYNHCK